MKINRTGRINPESISSFWDFTLTLVMTFREKIKLYEPYQSPQEERIIMGRVCDVHRGCFENRWQCLHSALGILDQRCHAYPALNPFSLYPDYKFKYYRIGWSPHILYILLVCFWLETTFCLTGNNNAYIFHPRSSKNSAIMTHCSLKISLQNSRWHALK